MSRRNTLVIGKDCPESEWPDCLKEMIDEKTKYFTGIKIVVKRFVLDRMDSYTVYYSLNPKELKELFSITVLTGKKKEVCQDNATILKETVSNNEKPWSFLEYEKSKDNPHWIPGAPTKPGWCWMKIVDANEDRGFYTVIDFFEESDFKGKNKNDYLLCGLDMCYTINKILAHCPIEEPEE